MDDRRAMDAIFVRLRTGCQWHALSATALCSSSSAHRLFREWTAADVFQELWRRGLTVYDALEGLDWTWPAADGAMTKAPLGGQTSGRNPTDRGRQGTRRRVLTEADGIPIGLAVAGANRHDVMLLAPTFERAPVPRPRSTRRCPQGRCLDTAYDIARVYRPTSADAARRSSTAPGTDARGWVVERTHGWMNRFRGLLIRWAKRTANHEGSLHRACALHRLRPCRPTGMGS